MSSLGEPKPANATIRYPGSKILSRNRHPVRVANYQLKKQFASVNISRVVSCNSWYPSTHSKFNPFHGFTKQNHRARCYNYHADLNQISHDPRNILSAVLVIGGVFIIVWGSERIHLIF
ncbi:hypothetical protein MKX01_041436 [Papaver californicum]|nr:hypothetical protein MKX01_041436 [Papaver californicum]